MSEPETSTSVRAIPQTGEHKAGEPSRIRIDDAKHPLNIEEGVDHRSYSNTNDSSAESGSDSYETAAPHLPTDLDALSISRNGSSNISNLHSTTHGASRHTSIQAQLTQQATPDIHDTGGNDAMNVRRNMLLAAWNGSHLTKGRKWVLILRLLIGLIQFVAGVTILALPASMGDSMSTPERCAPEGMFVYLTLHTIRVFFSIPIDVYLGLSPHRTPRSRRAGADGLLDRERTRTVGSLTLDRKLSRFNDLLGFCHVVLFIVGNYTVWTSIECSHAPAESRPLWITCVSMLSITYVIILEVCLMIFLIVFFLPVLIAILRALGLASRLPQGGIHPETGKIAQDTIDEQSRLVYFTLAKEDEGEAVLASERDARTSREDLEIITAQGMQEQSKDDDGITEAVITPLPLSRSTSMHKEHNAEPSSSPQRPRRKRVGVLFGFGRNSKVSDTSSSTQKQDQKWDDSTKPRLKYPIYPIPAHRATCPICLCDFEEISAETGSRNTADDTRGEAEKAPQPQGQTSMKMEEEQPDDEVEPLRLLRCGHVMHKSCVDQWLTTVSGRCPVCQKPIVTSVHDNKSETETTVAP
ncbi:hypothetical protein CBS101457_004105 [Exobasidium rhododendri]|nr:hypothetical protein CBS101457_004105 [Exobasidium rhododendri]